MTMTQQPTPQTQPTGLHPADHVRLAEQVKVAVLFVGKQTDVTLPASSPVAAVVDSLVRILQNRETEEDGGLRSPDDDRMVSPGLVTLTLIDGRPLDRTQSLAQQGVADGDLLILEITDAEVEFTPIVEAPSSAVAVLNAARYSAVTAETTRVFAGVTGAVTVLVVIGVFLVCMVAIGVWGMRRTTTLNDFFLGGRAIGPWVSAFAYGTTYFSAVLFIGFAGKLGWGFGLARACGSPLGNALVGSLLAWLVLGRRTRRMTQNLDVMTMPEFFEERVPGARA